VARHTLIDLEAGEVAERGLQLEFFKYPLQTGVGTRNNDMVQITGWAGDQVHEMVQITKKCKVFWFSF
jgi:hypothetical protein